MANMTNVDHTYAWLSVANSDAKAAVDLAKNGHRPQALFLVQQSMQKAVKGLQISKGATYDEVESYSHGTLDSFLSLNLGIGKEGFVAEALGKLFEPSALERLAALHFAIAGKKDSKQKRRRREIPDEYRQAFPSLGFTKPDSGDSESIEAQFAALPPEGAATLMQALSNIQGIVHSATKKPLKFAVPPPDGDLFTWLYDQIMSELTERLPNIQLRKLTEPEAEIARAFLDMIGETSLREALARPAEWDIRLQFEWVVAYLSLYIVGSISWPHAVSTRYPARPGAPPDAIEAAKQRQMGFQHYSYEIGAIRHVDLLARQAVWATRALIKCHSKGIRLYHDSEESNVSI